MKLLKIIAAISIIVTLLFCFRLGTLGADTGVAHYPKTGTNELSKNQIAKMERFIVQQMKLGKIPGMVITVVKNDQVVYQRGFGFADLQRNRRVTSETLFELGSTSKAFTALGILWLEKKGLLSLKDPVKKYIPWFKMMKRKKIKDPTKEYLNRYIPWFYATQDIDITIEQLLHHTSGIAPGSIEDIPASDTSDSLEKTVRILMQNVMKPELDYYPGDKYSYATINYDILGLIIAKVSGRSYEDFMKDNIINPLGMSHTVLFRNQAGGNLAIGYKAGFLRPLAYHAPVYRGNTPAGYIISNADDMGEWLKAQLGVAKIAPFYGELVAQSHNDDYDYSNGWAIYRISNNLKFCHGGNNPNYSSYVEFRPQEKLGTVLLLNSNSQYAREIGTGIMNIINGRGRIPERLYDLNVDYDEISCLLILAVGIFMWLTIGFTVKRYQLNPKYLGMAGKHAAKFLIFWLLMIAFFIVYYFLPKIILGYGWSFVAVWAPVTVLVALFLIFAEILILFGYIFNLLFYEGKAKITRLKVRRPWIKF